MLDIICYLPNTFTHKVISIIQSKITLKFIYTLIIFVGEGLFFFKYINLYISIIHKYIIHIVYSIQK